MVNADGSESNWIPGQVCQAELREDTDRDPDDVKIHESTTYAVPGPVKGSFNDPSLCYCCAETATQEIAFGLNCYASCNHCLLVLEVLLVEIANTATRYRDAADNRRT